MQIANFIPHAKVIPHSCDSSHLKMYPGAGQYVGKGSAVELVDSMSTSSVEPGVSGVKMADSVIRRTKDCGLTSRRCLRQTPESQWDRHHDDRLLLVQFDYQPCHRGQS